MSSPLSKGMLHLQRKNRDLLEQLESNSSILQHRLKKLCETARTPHNSPLKRKYCYNSWRTRNNSGQVLAALNPTYFQNSPGTTQNLSNVSKQHFDEATLTSPTKRSRNFDDLSRGFELPFPKKMPLISSRNRNKIQPQPRKSCRECYCLSPRKLLSPESNVRKSQKKCARKSRPLWNSLESIVTTNSSNSNLGSQRRTLEEARAVICYSPESVFLRGLKQRSMVNLNGPGDGNLAEKIRTTTSGHSGLGAKRDLALKVEPKISSKSIHGQKSKTSRPSTCHGDETGATKEDCRKKPLQELLPCTISAAENLYIPPNYRPASKSCGRNQCNKINTSPPKKVCRPATRNVTHCGKCPPQPTETSRSLRKGSGFPGTSVPSPYKEWNIPREAAAKLCPKSSNPKENSRVPTISKKRSVSSKRCSKTAIDSRTESVDSPKFLHCKQGISPLMKLRTRLINVPPMDDCKVTSKNPSSNWKEKPFGSCLKETYSPASCAARHITTRTTSGAKANGIHSKENVRSRKSTTSMGCKIYRRNSDSPCFEDNVRQMVLESPSRNCCCSFEHPTGLVSRPPKHRLSRRRSKTKNLLNADKCCSHCCCDSRRLLDRDQPAGFLDDRRDLERPPCPRDLEERLPREWADKIGDYRQSNWFDCHAHEADLKKPTQHDLGNDLGPQNHKCVHRYILNDRLFPTPLYADHQARSRCMGCSLPREDPNPSQIFPRETKLNIHRNREEVQVILPQAIFSKHKDDTPKAGGGFTVYPVAEKEAKIRGKSKGCMLTHPFISKPLAPKLYAPADSLALRYQKGMV